MLALPKPTRLGVLPSVGGLQHTYQHALPRSPLRRHKVNQIKLNALPTELMLADFAVDNFLPALGIKPDMAVVFSAMFAMTSVVANFLGGVQLEKQRAQLQLELERDKIFQQQLREVQGIIARYRGPLLESAIDLEQRLWHLVVDQCFDQRSGEALKEEIRYLTFALAQFMGFIEVVRREGPRERSFLQAGNPQGADTLSTLVEGFRFVLAASPAALEHWYLEGTVRTHPGARNRRSREEVLSQHALMTEHGCVFHPEVALLRVSRGHQRAIGSYMIITPMGAERHYTQSYGDFHQKLETDQNFRYWFNEIETDILALATGNLWQGEGPFPIGRWTRILLLQQLLVELWDLLDPDCVRLPLDRRMRLTPINWAKLPRLSAYQRRLQELSQAMDYGQSRDSNELEGIKDLLSMPKVDEAPLTSSFHSVVSYDSNDEDSGEETLSLLARNNSKKSTSTSSKVISSSPFSLVNSTINRGKKKS